MSDRPLILVSNDDGVAAAGIVALREALAGFADVYTVAPQLEQSAKSHSITLHHPLRFHEVEPRVWAVDGTPADCVYVAFFLADLLPRRPDLVVSGINHGPNLGNDVHYSGTVAAAREGTLRGVPSIAFSNSSSDMEGAAQYAKRFCKQLLGTTAPEGQAVLLNVNFPPVPPKGIRATRLGLRLYADEGGVRDEPRGRHYLWIGGPGHVKSHPVEGADTEALDEGLISITPLSIEATQPDHMGVAAYVAGPAKDR
ncbi:MAG: 5'/3'-nucleotidase SurE [Deltaproteobacteria bacterium]|nr:MAG: 5'/3'-nucleotidase SurE [Deltaproteobacteria bacterium]